MSVIGELAAGIAHEIRNPLTSIKGFIQFLKESYTYDDRSMKYYKIMEEEIDRMNEVIGELLIISKPHQKDFTEERVEGILEDVILLMSTAAQKKGY
ncbi:histidine kinase dimerization/phospho-acceptor domain-containing protein [Bacillus carboniphilus]|uniref:histidine kinase n=1 Tax=Bacillus carboniphilus TaxID=86663 RepID=A0ABY9JPN9_9BACI|nr:histidine kinase dimerization/phospho-acceptor domain-containing protein [Bacillus carboniphilus]WLR41277.1 histidine kinase dimerization/phospho-acceptor domain-containing protein [Bacillus carboniphilus]